MHVAYEVLADADKRKIYDRFGEEGLKQQGGGRQDAGDIFQKCASYDLEVVGI